MQNLACENEFDLQPVGEHLLKWVRTMTRFDHGYFQLTQRPCAVQQKKEFQQRNVKEFNGYLKLDLSFSKIVDVFP